MDDPLREDRQQFARFAEVVQGLAALSTDGRAGDLALRASEMLEELLVADEELRVQAEELVASREVIDAERERYVDLFELLPDAVVEVDDEGRILDANEAASRLLGVATRIIVGKLLVSFAVNNDRRTVRRLLRSAHGDGVETIIGFQNRTDHVVRTTGVLVARRSDEPHTPSVWVIRDLSPWLAAHDLIKQLSVETDAYRRLSGLQRLSTDADPVRAVVERVTAASGALFEKVVLSVQLDAWDDVVSTNEIGHALSSMERAAGEGPLTEAATGGQPLFAEGDELVNRWLIGHYATDVGARSVHALPIIVDGEPVGAVAGWSFDDSRTDGELLTIIAAQIAMAVANAQVLATVTEHGVNLERAMLHRGVIEQAKGMLMQSLGIQAGAAFDVLRVASQRRNQKLRDLAEAVVSGTVALADLDERASGPMR
jgi:PAS domain S-box-containing protein